MKRHKQGRADVFTFDGLADRTGRLLTTAIIAPPDGGRGDLHNLLERAIDRLADLDDATTVAKRDAGLNELERVKRVAPKRAAAQQAVEAALVYSRHALKTTAECRAMEERADQLAELDADEREARRVLESAASLQRVLDRVYTPLGRPPRPMEGTYGADRA